MIRTASCLARKSCRGFARRFSYRHRLIEINRQLNRFISTSIFQRFNHTAACAEKCIVENPDDRFKCWKCGVENCAARSSFQFCEKLGCGAIQPLAEKMDFFDVMNIEHDFDINEKDLKVNYHKNQVKVHPDSYGQKSEIEQKLAELSSSYVNKAYATLKDPLSRAKYLLSLNNVSVKETDGANDSELLMAVLETREAINEATSDADLAALRKENNERYERSMETLRNAFKKKDYSLARKSVVELQYWSKIAHSLEKSEII